MTYAGIPSFVQSNMITVNGSRLHYLEAGRGDPIVFLHGNPTSSYLWRNVLPHVIDSGRCIALDYVGMGRSDKPAIAYRLVEHCAYLDAFLATLDVAAITLVTHDWGVVLGLDLCRRWPDRVRRIALMEGHIHPIKHWTDFDPEAQAMFRALRSPDRGPRMVLDENFFIETILPAGMQRTLTPDEMAVYRAPYPTAQARRPLLQWVREIPIEGQPADVHAMVSANQAYLATSTLPKLLLYAQPGAVIGATEVAWCQEHCHNLTTIDVGRGLHFLPEDHADRIGTAIATWLTTN